MCDFELAGHGSIVLLTPMTSEANEWIEEHIDPCALHWGLSIVIEPRYLADIRDGIENDGLTIEEVA